jgi:hypothetical protein
MWRLRSGPSGGESSGKVWMVLVPRGWLLLGEEYDFSFWDPLRVVVCGIFTLHNSSPVK